MSFVPPARPPPFAPYVLCINAPDKYMYVCVCVCVCVYDVITVPYPKYVIFTRAQIYGIRL